eukprot:9894779-Alexandrium_andersonii.AAC.1
MSASLVGSEMCIRDRSEDSSHLAPFCAPLLLPRAPPPALGQSIARWGPCLLYTSDAADDM